MPVRMDDNHHSAVCNGANTYKALLAVVLSSVPDCQYWSAENEHSLSKMDAMLGKVSRGFVRIPLKLHTALAYNMYIHWANNY